jgi:hypothetical protein
MSKSPATRILDAWVELEGALRAALPICSVAPPTQPSELLAALRINHRIGPQEEARIQTLRETRNRIAHDPGEPEVGEALAFEEEVLSLMAALNQGPSENPPECA